jgi:hypothetical protein
LNPLLACEQNPSVSAWPDRLRAAHRGGDLALVVGTQSRTPKVHRGGFARVINRKAASILGATTGVYRQDNS